jgi:[1-hydroxy-2-(trimethylamino)ethyl]phosphonate dioxygenase
MTSTLDRELTELFEGRGRARYGLEAISQLEHALQTADLAERQGEPPAMILAALLHDVGHMIHAMGENPAANGRDDHHEALGAKWLAKRVAPSVSEPVRLHVAAKRYLCATEAGYAAHLAPDSILSLTLQGGPMSAEEAHAFRDLPFADEAVRLRKLDDAAKDPDAVTPPIAHFLRHLPAALIDIA